MRLLRPRSAAGPLAALLVFLVGTALLTGLSFVHVLQGQAGLTPGEVVSAIFQPEGLESAIVRYARLPRLAVALLAGAALGIAGVLMQAVTRNPLASPATVGVNAGAHIALVVAAVVAPGLLAAAGWWLASAGGLAAAVLTYALAGAGRGGPTRLALAGIAVALALSAMTGALQLLFENEMGGLFLWGAGTLAQSDWGGALFAWPRVAAGIVAALLLAPSLDLLLLGEDVARGLGGRVVRTRVLAGGAGVLLAATAVSVVGPISFVGLMAPHLVRLTGVRAHAALVPGAAIWGALLLVGADVLARLVPSGAMTFPVGAATAFLGAPFIVWLARKSAAEGNGRSGTSLGRRRPPPYWPVLFLSLAGLLAGLLAGVALGAPRIPLGEVVAVLGGGGEELARRVILDQRLPRLLVAALAGAALSASGALLQGVVRNPLAAPEIVGVTSGAGAAALTALILFPELPLGLVPAAAFTGGVLAFALVYAGAWKGGLEPVRLALVGLAVSALLSAVINALVVAAGLRVAQALTWLAGSTYARTWDDLARLAPWVLLLLPVAWFLASRLDIMALGEDLPVALGLPLERSRLWLLTLAVALAASAVAAVGTLSFAGLMGPHIARALSGPSNRRLLPVAALVGAVLVVAADTVGRVLFAPREIPSGLVTAALGAPYFLFLLLQARRSA